MGTFPNKTAEKTNELSKTGYFVNEFERTNTNKRAKMDFGEICWEKKNRPSVLMGKLMGTFPNKKRRFVITNLVGGGATDRRTMSPR